MQAAIELDVSTALSIRQIVASEHIAAAGPLLREHWLEVAKHRNLMVLDPDVDAYRRLEAAEGLISLGAFDGDEMVGYCVTVFQRQHLHYRGLAVASNDVIFMRRSSRLRGIGDALIAETERLAAERGAGLVFWHAKYGTALDDKLFSGGYSVQDVIYGKPLAAAKGAA